MPELFGAGMVNCFQLSLRDSATGTNAVHLTIYYFQLSLRDSDRVVDPVQVGL